MLSIELRTAVAVYQYGVDSDAVESVKVQDESGVDVSFVGVAVTLVARYQLNVTPVALSVQLKETVWVPGAAAACPTQQAATKSKDRRGRNRFIFQTFREEYLTAKRLRCWELQLIRLRTSYLSSDPVRKTRT